MSVNVQAGTFRAGEPALAPASHQQRAGLLASLMQVSPGARFAPVAGRFKDEPAFSGGDFIASKFAGHVYQCSSGFGMHFAYRKGAPFFMLTAGHCIDHSHLLTEVFWVCGNHKNVGTTFSFSADNDAVTLDTRGGVRGAGGAHTIYVGNTSLKSRGQSRADVKGAASIVAGDLVSTSGAFSGERTRIKVKTTDWEWMASTVDGLTSHHDHRAQRGVHRDNRGWRPASEVLLDIEIPLMTGTATSIEANLNLAMNVG